jgi:hypothetical protein
MIDTFMMCGLMELSAGISHRVARARSPKCWVTAFRSVPDVKTDRSAFEQHATVVFQDWQSPQRGTGSTGGALLAAIGGQSGTMCGLSGARSW